MMNIKIAALVLLGALCLTLPVQAAPVHYGSMIHNLDATTDPGATDDVSPGGYTVGSMWVNVSDDTVWICADNTNGAAVWKQVDAAGSGATTLPNLTDVTSATQTSGFGLMSDGGNYYGRALTAADMTPALASEYFPLDGDVGVLIDTSADAVTTTWAPPVAGFGVVKATGSNCSLQVNGPTGTVGSGLVDKLLAITNSCGDVMTVTINGSDYSINGLTTFTVADSSVGYLLVETDDSGSAWRAYGPEDITKRPTITVTGTDYCPVQDNETADVAAYVPCQDIADLHSGNETHEVCVALGPNSLAITDGATAMATGVRGGLYLGSAATIVSARAYIDPAVGTAPTGAAIVFDIKESGTTMLSTSGTIDATEFTTGTGTAPAFSDTSLTANAPLTFDVTQIGSTEPGNGLVGCVTYY
jgi:hypothetical protein